MCDDTSFRTKRPNQLPTAHIISHNIEISHSSSLFYLKCTNSPFHFILSGHFRMSSPPSFRHITALLLLCISVRYLISLNPYSGELL